VTPRRSSPSGRGSWDRQRRALESAQRFHRKLRQIRALGQANGGGGGACGFPGGAGFRVGALSEIDERRQIVGFLTHSLGSAPSAAARVIAESGIDQGWSGAGGACACDVPPRKEVTSARVARLRLLRRRCDMLGLDTQS